MGEWSKLNATEKAKVIKWAIDNGVSDINIIRDTYNIYASGGKIHIAPSKKGTFTAAATKHGKSVQEFARQVLANKENYSPAMVKKANFARNAAKWHKGAEGLDLNVQLPEVAVTPRGNYITYTGNETIAPNIDDYITSKQEEARIDAVNHILNLKAPIVPIVPNQSILSKIAGVFGMSPEERIRTYGAEQNPLTCITTATGVFPKGSTASSVEMFSNNPENYGFILDETLQPRIGDLMVFRKFLGRGNNHGTVVTGFNVDRKPVLTYSRGGSNEEDIIRDNDNWSYPDSNNYLGNLGIGLPYRFVGTPQQQQKWIKEYNTLYNKKSTGGPLYPFSFSKQPLPQVRYDDGGPIRNWDNTLTGKLINYVENPDSIGWNPVDRTWEHPTDSVKYDINQIGMGVDKNQTPGYWNFIQYRDNKAKTPYLTELNERLLRFNAIEAANKSANQRYKYAQTAVNRPNGAINKVKDAAVVSAIYNLGAGTVANGLFEDKDFMLKLFDGTDKEVIDRINLEYKKKNRNERIRRTNEFLTK